MQLGTWQVKYFSETQRNPLPSGTGIKPLARRRDRRDRREKYRVCRFLARPAEYISMEPQSIHRTFNLKPTPEQERVIFPNQYS